MPSPITDQSALWRHFRRFPTWRTTLIAVRDAPGCTTGEHAKAGRVSDASNALDTLRALEGRGLVTRDPSRQGGGRGTRWTIRRYVSPWLDASSASDDVGQIRAPSRIATIARDQLPALAELLLDDSLADEIEWVAALEDREAGALVGFVGRASGTEAAAVKAYLRERGVVVDDVRVDVVAVTPESMTAWARRVLGLDGSGPTASRHARGSDSALGTGS